MSRKRGFSTGRNQRRLRETGAALRDVNVRDRRPSRREVGRNECLGWNLLTGAAKTLGKHRIMGFSQGKIPGCRVGSDDAQGDAVGSLFVQRHKKRRIEGAAVIGVKQLQAFNDAPADQQFAVYPDFS